MDYSHSFKYVIIALLSDKNVNTAGARRMVQNRRRIVLRELCSFCIRRLKSNREMGRKQLLFSTIDGHSLSWLPLLENCYRQCFMTEKKPGMFPQQDFCTSLKFHSLGTIHPILTDSHALFRDYFINCLLHAIVFYLLAERKTTNCS